MKKAFLLALAFVCTVGAFAQAKVEETVKFNKESHDFGKVKQGVPVTYYFEIKNITDKPVVVENTYASCGCTTPEKIVEPIMPGATVKLKVDYNAAAVGPINKDVFIKLAGIDQIKTLKITGEVMTAEAYETYMKERGAKEPAPKKN